MLVHISILLFIGRTSEMSVADHRPVTIAVDAMGGDEGADICVPAAIEMLDKDRKLTIILVGDNDILQSMTGEAHSRLGDRLQIEAASQVVRMDEHPRDAVRKKKDSSMRVAINLVKEGRADACVSAGNTGALMATAKFVLKTLPGIRRPAIISTVPAIGGHTHMLDLGANANCTAEQLYQFAVMGSIVATDIHELARPRIGLLNIGEEEIKGNDTIREAARMISESTLNYIGFVEGNDIFSGKVDVVVSDGFTGNVALKTMEGVAEMINGFLRKEFTRSVLRKGIALVAMPVLSALKRTFDPRLYNGASLVGLNGIVVKSHGGADQIAFQNALQTAIVEIDKGVPEHIRKLLSEQPL